MKIRHAAALLLMGWILMVPPDSTIPHSVDSAAPLSRWREIAEFDNAGDCRKALVTLQTKNPDFPATLDPTGERRGFKKRQPADPELAHARVSNATCIASDDPRMAK